MGNNEIVFDWPKAVPHGDGCAVALLVDERQVIHLDGSEATRLANELYAATRRARYLRGEDHAD